MTTATSYPHTQLLIDNVWCDPAGGKSIAVVNPATGQEIGRVAHAEIADLDRALAAAERGFETWRNTTAHDRSIIIRKAAAIMRERMLHIATLMTMEQGKPLAEAKMETLGSVDTMEWFADEAKRVYGRIVPARSMSVMAHVLKQPVGVVAAFTPWNFPLNQVVRKMCAALATGCSIIVKAPEETPASPAELVRAFVDAGVPPGVVGLVFGDPATISSYLIPHPIVRKITFTGSTPVGKMLAGLAGQHMKRVTMELGGHAPVIVAEDADVALAVKATAASKFRNAGQVCIAPTRFLVHNSLKAEFTRLMAEASQKLKVGDGLTDGTTMGPLANVRRITAMEKVMADAHAKGATIVSGGERIGTAGNFFAPTVVADVPLDASLFNDEPFGPIAGIRGFDTLDEAINESNRLPFGLASYAFTRSLKTMHALSQHVQVGMLWINQPAVAVAEMPFGGVKDSGYGSEGGPEALEAYLNTKTVSTMCV
jgi:succinate-semialdehyde dehydrogenase / glutarate-semialdehyde dehydrogenase